MAAGALIAYWNGANDVSNGIATLVGSGVTDYRRAIVCGALCTGLGGREALDGRTIRDLLLAWRVTVPAAAALGVLALALLR
ncbi:MAG: hypothetical protein L0221_04025 [Chloroflexi bacterium]|nr:hypothetical protein [Chloroflexota bacterium]